MRSENQPRNLFWRVALVALGLAVVLGKSGLAIRDAVVESLRQRRQRRHP